ncbi:TetR/AcrR family transcriptional regulator [Microbacterium sp. RD1]|uniref:TetR/AcrR family transcriptional regulator n=1 Tax=Microbacterium sp. RD1 TaxID=3457313 RepID=UPI003FA602B9
MTGDALTYHQRVATDKRAAILVAARELFSQHGYDKTSLVRVAERANVSTATLFKQFPNKAALFEAIVLSFWSEVGTPESAPAPGDPHAGLRSLGSRYAALLLRDGMAGLFRLVIAEAPQFPELARIQFDLGKAPFFDEVRRYIEEESASGSLAVEEPEMAATQFLGMISNYVLWPRMLLVDWELPTGTVDRVVDSAVETFLARYR